MGSKSIDLRNLMDISVSFGELPEGAYFVHPSASKPRLRKKDGSRGKAFAEGSPSELPAFQLRLTPDDKDVIHYDDDVRVIRIHFEIHRS